MSKHLHADIDTVHIKICNKYNKKQKYPDFFFETVTIY